MNDNLIQQSSIELTRAGNVQQQISQKEFEIKLVDINGKYLSNQDAGSYYYNQQRKQLLEMEISSLKAQRDGNINSALYYALMLAEKEITDHVIFSSASILIANICSFLRIQNISFSASMPIVIKVSTLYSQLNMMNTVGFVSLKRELLNLKMQLHI